MPATMTYPIQEILYESDTTRVARATTSDERSFVLKSLKKDRVDAQHSRQFKREYDILLSLPEGCVPQAHEMQSIDGEPTIITKDIGGIDLRRRGIDGTINIDTFLDWAVKITQCLATIHANGVAHLDINPTNILIAEDNSLRLIDFGISNRFELSQNQTFHHHNTLSGTLYYLAPEQTGRVNRSIDNRADFYSLGITLFEILTGQRPFQGGDPLELIHAHIARQPKRVTEIRDGIPAMICDILDKLMSKNADDRYQSAKGLLNDLERCAAAWGKDQTIPRFEIALTDISGTLRTPQHLYGRDKDIAKLCSAYETAAPGSKRVVAVSGVSGSGKTALVRELFAPVTKSKGIICDGKFDQFQHDQPHQAFTEAFRKLLQWILSENDKTLLDWKNHLIESLQEVGSVLTDVLPELEIITGPLPTAPNLSGEEARNRFIYAIRLFIQTVAKRITPLVIFIDDCQWMDVGSKKLFSLMADSDACPNLMLVCAFRDLKTCGETPFKDVLRTLQESPAFMDIHLNGLDVTDINDLVRDILHGTPATDELAKIVHTKTGGNPFFATQFIKGAYSDGLLAFDGPNHAWTWDTKALKSQKVEDNVVEFMHHRLRQLPETTAQILATASCVGHEFSLTLLADISDMDESACEATLAPALTEGIVIPMGNDVLGFAHDRIQEALYAPQAEESRLVTHQKIGQSLTRNINQSSNTKLIFDAVHHLNQCIDILNEDEQEQLLSLNLRAAEAASQSSAFSKAHEFYDVAITLTPGDIWKLNYELTLPLYSNGAEAAYLAGDYETSSKHCDAIVEHARDDEDAFEARLVRIKASHAQGDLTEAVTMARDALAAYGLTYPDEPSMEDVGGAVGELLQRLGPMDIESLADLPQATEPDVLAAMRIIADASDASYFAAPLLLPLFVVEQVRMTLDSGLTKESSIAFALMGLILCSIGQYDMGERCALLSLKLLDIMEADKHRCKTELVAYNTVLHWKRHVREIIEPLRDAHHWGLKTGDTDFGSVAIHCVWYNAFLAGMPLDDLDNSLEETMAVMRSLNQAPPQHFIMAYGQHMQNIRRTVSEPWKLNGDMMNEEALLAELSAMNNLTGFFVYHFNRTIVGFLFGHVEQALGDALEAEKYLGTVSSLFIVPILHMYKALCVLEHTADATQKEQEKPLEAARQCLEILEGMAAPAPMNHAHRVSLLKAEIAWKSGDATQARVLYDQAISEAQENEYINDRALICLQAGKFYLAEELPKLSRLYLAEAVSDYRKWGAHGLADHLPERFGQHINRQAATQAWRNTTMTISATETTMSSLDVNSLFKSVKALSTQMDTHRLMEKAMAVIMENIGAERVVLVEIMDGEFMVRTNGSAHSPTALKEPIPLSQYKDAPSSIIMHTARKQTPIIVDEPHRDGIYGKDSYIIRNRPQSVMAYPAFRKGELIAVAYLEHSVMSDLFIHERTEVLEILLGQIMVSLENAHLYEQLKEYSRTLEEKVAKRTAELKASNSELERLTRVDGLTGIANRRHFDSTLQAEWVRMAREGEPLSLILLDIDYFKPYNDTYGHQQGDDCLVDIANVLATHARRIPDLAARYGGEEFAIILPGTDSEGAVRVAEMLRNAIAERKLQHESSEIADHITASIGVVTRIPRDGGTPEDAIEKADHALYQAKKQGRNRVCQSL